MPTSTPTPTEPAAGADALLAMSDAEFAASQRMTPLQRSSTPEDVAAAVRRVVAERLQLPL